MRCRRICRELLWLARFGDFGPSSQPHLDHLSRCQHCRDEVGYDRETVRQLREALAARIEGMEPSPTAWEGVLHRALSPEPGRLAAWFQRRARLVGRMRTATALAGSGLALVLALNMEVVPVSVPAETDADSRATSLAQVPRMPTGRTTLVALARSTDFDASPSEPDPETLMTGVEARTNAMPASESGEPSGDFTVVFEPPAGQQPSLVDHDDATDTSVTRAGAATGVEPFGDDGQRAPLLPVRPGEPS